MLLVDDAVAAGSSELKRCSSPLTRCSSATAKKLSPSPGGGSSSSCSFPPAVAITSPLTLTRTPSKSCPELPQCGAAGAVLRRGSPRPNPPSQLREAWAAAPALALTMPRLPSVVTLGGPGTVDRPKLVEASSKCAAGAAETVSGGTLVTASAARNGRAKVLRTVPPECSRRLPSELSASGPLHRSSHQADALHRSSHQVAVLHRSSQQAAARAARNGQSSLLGPAARHGVIAAAEAMPLQVQGSASALPAQGSSRSCSTPGSHSQTTPRFGEDGPASEVLRKRPAPQAGGQVPLPRASTESGWASGAFGRADFTPERNCLCLD
mmetsp:Transcript_43363/g.97928  ORF Transcript_43363/g.97928 Transcript_43363/m.97928 type:complete len:324 (+) Transcript_43363:109-1080(+)